MRDPWVWGVACGPHGAAGVHYRGTWSSRHDPNTGPCAHLATDLVGGRGAHPGVPMMVQFPAPVPQVLLARPGWVWGEQNCFKRPLGDSWGSPPPNSEVHTDLGSALGTGARGKPSSVSYSGPQIGELGLAWGRLMAGLWGCLGAAGRCTPERKLSQEWRRSGAPWSARLPSRAQPGGACPAWAPARCDQGPWRQPWGVCGLHCGPSCPTRTARPPEAVVSWPEPHTLGTPALPLGCAASGHPASGKWAVWPCETCQRLLLSPVDTPEHTGALCMGWPASTQEQGLQC